MKKVLYVLTVITALCVALFCITSCAEHSADSSFENPSSERVESESDMQKIYTVTFDNVAQSVTVKNGERVEPLDPDYNGREFIGWATDEGEIWDFSKPITEDLTLYAKYSKEWGTVISSQVISGTTASSKIAPDGFKFVGVKSGFSGQDFISADISEYDEVRFSTMYNGNGYYLLDGWNKYAQAIDHWFTFNLTNQGNDRWVIRLDYNGRLQNGERYFEKVASGNNLKTILSFISGDKQDPFYITELRGTKRTWGKEVVSSPVKGQITEEKPPKGYEKTTKTQGFTQGEFENVSLLGYERIKFAVKYNGYYLFNSTPYKAENKWVEVTLTNLSDKEWEITVDFPSSATEMNTKKVAISQGEYLNDLLEDILYSGNRDEAYFTEIRGGEIEKESLGFTKIAVSTDDYKDEETEYAVQEFVYFYEEITGEKLSVEVVNGVEELSEEENYVVIGGDLATCQGLDFSGITSQTGYKLFSDGGNAYLYGKNKYANLKAIYAFFEYFYTLRFYADDVYTFNRYGRLNGVNLEELDITFNPSIDYNWAMDGYAVHIPEYTNQPNWDYQRRLGYVNGWERLDGGWHNFLTLVPESEYGANHPDWFTNLVKDGEVVLDGDDNPIKTLNLSYNDFEMATVVAQKIYEVVKSKQNTNSPVLAYQFSAPDYMGWSASPTSTALYEKYGSNTAEYILFMNRVAKILDTEYSLGQELTLYLLAYNYTVSAPDYCEELAFYKGENVDIGVVYAPIEKHMNRPLDDGTLNTKYKKPNSYYLEQFEKWQSYGGDVTFWNYSTYYDNYFIPIDSVSNMQKDYAYLAEKGVNTILDLGQTGVLQSTDWQALKIYLKGQLANDAQQDVNQLIDRFFDAYYGKGQSATYMKKFFFEEMAWLAEISKKSVEKHGADQTGIHVIRSALFNKEYWDDTPTNTKYDSSMLKRWLSYLDKALEGAESRSAEERIKAESVSIRYMLLKVYQDTSYGTMDDLKEYCKSIGIDRFAEGSAWTGIWKNEIVSGEIDNLA